MTARTAIVSRATRETSITVTLTLDGTGKADVKTGLGFLDHLLEALSRHARFDVTLACEGDLHVDDHHTAEDCALALGQALDVVDLSGRSYADVTLDLSRETIGGLACENIPHILRSLAAAGRLTLHVDVLKGENDHHRAEAAFKATALALKQAVACSGFDDVPSTKGTLGEKGGRDD